MTCDARHSDSILRVVTQAQGWTAPPTEGREGERRLHRDRAAPPAGRWRRHSGILPFPLPPPPSSGHTFWVVVVASGYKPPTPDPPHLFQAERVSVVAGRVLIKFFFLLALRLPDPPQVPRDFAVRLRWRRRLKPQQQP